MTLLRRILYILLLLCLPMSGFAMQGSWPPVAAAASVEHALDHAEGIHHHHDSDGSVHYDESDASLDHTQEHCSAQPAGFGLPRLTVPPEQAVQETGSYIAQAVPEPFLALPHRPPARSLGHLPGE